MQCQYNEQITSKHKCRQCRQMRVVWSIEYVQVGRVYVILGRSLAAAIALWKEKFPTVRIRANSFHAGFIKEFRGNRIG